MRGHGEPPLADFAQENDDYLAERYALRVECEREESEQRWRRHD